MTWPRLDRRPTIYWGQVMTTKKVNAWGKDQGSYVIIEAADFDEKTHKEYQEKPEAKDKRAAK